MLCISPMHEQNQGPNEVFGPLLRRSNAAGLVLTVDILHQIIHECLDSDLIFPVGALHSGVA